MLIDVHCPFKKKKKKKKKKNHFYECKQTTIMWNFVFLTRLKRLLMLYNGFTLVDGSVMMVRDAPTVRHFFGGDCFFLGVLISWAAWRFEPERVGLKEKHKDY